MKHPLIWIGWIIGLSTATYIRSFGSDTGVFLQARTTPRLLARTNGYQRSGSRSPQRQATPHAVLFAEGPATLSKNGPDGKKFSIPKGAQTQLLSHDTKNPYVDGRLLGEAPPHSEYQPLALHPLKAIANGQTATAQVSVPPKGVGFLKTTSSGERHTYFVPGGSEKKVRVESDTPGGAEAFASVTRPGKVNADAHN